MFKIAICNQKGGCGKTTTSINLAAGLAYAGNKVLLIDLDPQGNSTLGLGIKTDKRQTVAELLCQEECVINDILQDTYIEGLHILPSDSSLAVADSQLAQRHAKEFALRTKLTDIKYDYVIIDTPPTLGTLLTNALATAEYIILTVGLDYFNLAGIQNFVDTINLTNKVLGRVTNHRTEILGVLLNFFKTNTKHSKIINNAIHDIFGDKVFKTKIPENVKLKESQEKTKTIFDHAPRCSSAIAYSELTKEVEERLNYVRN